MNTDLAGTVLNARGKKNKKRKRKVNQVFILFPANWLFKNEGKINTLPDK